MKCASKENQNTVINLHFLLQDQGTLMFLAAIAEDLICLEMSKSCHMYPIYLVPHVYDYLFVK